MINCKTVLCIYLFLVLMSCKNDLDIQQGKVNINSVYMGVLPNSVERWATVEYTIENEGSKTINGWKIYFSVHFSNGPYLITNNSVYYNLDQEEISTLHSSSVLVPNYYDTLLNASLKHLEFW